MPATKESGTVTIAVDRPVWERLRKEAKRQDRKIRSVTTAVIVKGLEVIQREQHQPQHATDRT